MAFNPQDYDVKPIGAAGLTERTSLDGSERILVQAGADADVDTTPMQFFKYQVIKSKIDEIKEDISNLELSLEGVNTSLSSSVSGLNAAVGEIGSSVGTIDASLSNLISSGKSGIDTRTSFPPSLHVHGKLNMLSDSRSVATFPSDYNQELKFLGLKYASTIGLSSGDIHAYFVGLRGWSDFSGAHSQEIAFTNSGIYVRRGTSETTWSAWKTLITH
jgi:hypothetical protein